MKNQVTTQSQSLIVQNKEQLIAEAKRLITHKPKLIKAIDQKKIKEYTPQEQEVGNNSLITWILSLLGITTENNEKENHYLAVDLFIIEDLNKYSYEEIKEAFKMYVKGNFNEDFDKVIYKLDCVILSKVMTCYDKFKLESTRNYYNQLKRNIIELEKKRNELSEEQKFELVMQGIEESFRIFKEQGGNFNQTGRLYLYKFFFERGLLPKDSTTMNAVKNEAEKNIKSKTNKPITRKESNYSKAILSENSNELRNECYRLSIQRFYSKFTSFEQLKQKILNAKKLLK